MRDDGLGAILAGGRRAARDGPVCWPTRRLLQLHLEPELDIVTFFPASRTLSEVDARSAAVIRGRHERRG